MVIVMAGQAEDGEIVTSMKQPQLKSHKERTDLQHCLLCICKNPVNMMYLQ